MLLDSTSELSPSRSGDSGVGDAAHSVPRQVV
jgi:hypothetical protein